MTILRYEYQPIPSDFRWALYFGSMIRYYRAVQLYAIAVAAVVIYYIGGVLGGWPMYMLPLNILMGMGVGGVFVIARMEHRVLRYMRSEKGLIGKTVKLTFTGETLKVETPHDGGKSEYRIDRLLIVFETARMFLIYPDSQQAIMLPLRVVDFEERRQLREWIRAAMGARFQSRFGLKAPKMGKLKI